MISENSLSDYGLESLFCRENTSAVRALATIGILFCHLSETMTPDSLNPFIVFLYTGYIPVSLFFFFSGFNLFYGFLNNPDGWRKGFWRKKFFRIYLPFLFANAVYQIFNWINGIGPFQIRGVIHYLLGIDLLNSTLWYVQSIILLYFLSYFAFRFVKIICKADASEMILTFTAVVIMAFYYVVYSRYGAYLDGYSNVPVPFFIGAIIVIWRKRLFPLWLRYRDYIFLFSLFLLCWSLAAQYVFDLKLKINGFDVYVLIATVAAPIAAMTILFGKQVQIPFLNLVSKYSFELYLLHAPCYRFFRYVINIENNFLYLSAYLISDIALAVALNKICSFLSRITTKKVQEKCHAVNC